MSFYSFLNIYSAFNVIFFNSISMKKLLRASNLNKSIESSQRQRQLQSTYKMHQIQKAYLQVGSNLRGSRSVRLVHSHKSPFFRNQGTEKVYESILQLQNAKTVVFLMYKKKRFSFKFDLNTTFAKVHEKIFEQLAIFQMETNKLNKAQRKMQLLKIKGFKTLDSNINFDYRLSLEEGVLENSVFLTVFQKPQPKRKNLYKDPKKPNSSYQLQKDINMPFPDEVTFKQFYEIYSCLAIGGFSKVYLVRSYTNGKFYAIKCIRRENLCKNSTKQKIEAEREKFESIVNEIELCKNNNHTFIIKLHHAFATHNFYCLAFQYCPGGQLFYLLKKVKVMSQENAKFYFIQILYAIQYLHNKNIIYRDLKPENILVDYKGNLKIVDFGLSKTVETKRQKTYSYCGSAEYMAPQMIMRTGHSFPIDYYSLGTLLYELVTGLPPFYTKDQAVLQQSICCQQLSFPRHTHLSEEIKDLLLKLLQKDAKYRLGSLAGIKQILCHPWIGKTKALEILNKVLPSPYPPNLKQHNFDPNQLGSDQSQFTYDVLRDFDISKNQECPIVQNFYNEFESCNFFDQKIEKINKDCLKKTSEINNTSKSQKVCLNIQNQPFFHYIQSAEAKINEEKLNKQNQKAAQTLAFYSPKKRKIIQYEINKIIDQQQQKSILAQSQDRRYTLSSEKKQNILKNVILKVNSSNKKKIPKGIRHNLIQYNSKIDQEPKTSPKAERYQSNQPITHHQTYHFSNSRSSDKFKNKFSQNRAIRIKDKITRQSSHLHFKQQQQNTLGVGEQSNDQKQVEKKILVSKHSPLYKQMQYIKKLPKPYLKSSLQYIKSSMKSDKRYNGLYQTQRKLKKTAKGTFNNQKTFQKENCCQQPNCIPQLSNQINLDQNNFKFQRKVLKQKGGYDPNGKSVGANVQHMESDNFVL